MKYYKVKKHADSLMDWRTGYTAIQNELLTPVERKKRFPDFSDRAFDVIVISKKKTYISFGCRFEDK